MSLRTTLYNLFAIEEKYIKYRHSAAKKAAEYLINNRHYREDSFWITKPDYDAMTHHLAEAHGLHPDPCKKRRPQFYA